MHGGRSSSSDAGRTSTCMHPGDTEGSPNASACFSSSALLSCLPFWPAVMIRARRLAARKQRCAVSRGEPQASKLQPRSFFCRSHPECKKRRSSDDRAHVGTYRPSVLKSSVYGACSTVQGTSKARVSRLVAVAGAEFEAPLQPLVMSRRARSHGTERSSQKRPIRRLS